jgi:uncharacterized protein (UPF0548 family)
MSCEHITIKGNMFIYPNCEGWVMTSWERLAIKGENMNKITCTLTSPSL